MLTNNRHPAQRGPAAPRDWMRDFVDHHIAAEPLVVGEASESAQQILDTWYDRLGDATFDYDTSKAECLRELAEASMLRAIADEDTRLLQSVLRCLPPGLVFRLAGKSDASDAQTYARILQSCTVAVMAGSRQRYRVSAIGGGATSVDMSEAQLIRIRRQLPVAVARLIGAAAIRDLALILYRRTGKGLKFKDFGSPSNLYQELAEGDLLVEDKKIDEAIEEYDSRRGDTPGYAGMLTDDPEEMNIYALGVSFAHLPVCIVAPSANLNITSGPYVITASEYSFDWELLNGLNTIEGQDGFNTGAAVCGYQAIMRAILRQTGFNAGMLTVDDHGFEVRLREDVEPQLAARAAGYLRDITSRGRVRAPRQNWIDIIANAFREGDYEDPAAHAEEFIDRFTLDPSIFGGPWPPLVPALFLNDGDALILDLVHSSDFLLRCAHAAGEGDGKIGNLRSKAFEEAARNFIRRELQLAPDDEPWQANRDVKRGGRNYGDVDMCFIRGPILFHLDMKAWRRPLGYHCGDYKKVDNRQKELVKFLTSKVEPRGEQLREILREHGTRVKSVAQFICVPDIEYVGPNYPTLRYRNLPRVLTPREIVRVASRSRRGLHTLAADVARHAAANPSA